MPRAGHCKSPEAASIPYHLPVHLRDRTLAVTGVGGFIGLRMAERAREVGMAVRGIDVAPQAVARAARAGFDARLGDTCDEAAVRTLCAGADVVFHTAAIVRESGPWEAYRRVNVEGTRTVALAARDAGVRRFVHLSSVMVYGFYYRDGVDEDGPLSGDGNPYCQTKIESERAVLALHDPGRFEVIVIRPGDVYGPGSIPWVVRPMELIRKGIAILPDKGRGAKNHVYVDNLVDAVLLALERDCTGEAFNVTDGVSTSFKQYLEHFVRMRGRGRVRTAPAPVLRVLFTAVALASRAVGRQPPATAEAIRFLSRPGTYSIDKARRVLGYEPRVSLEEGMRRVEEWLRAEGYLEDVKGRGR